MIACAHPAACLFVTRHSDHRTSAKPARWRRSQPLHLQRDTRRARPPATLKKRSSKSVSARAHGACKRAYRGHRQQLAHRSACGLLETRLRLARLGLGEGGYGLERLAELLRRVGGMIQRTKSTESHPLPAKYLKPCWRRVGFQRTIASRQTRQDSSRRPSDARVQ